MAIEYMSLVNIPQYQGSRNTPDGFEYKGPEIATPSNGGSVLVPTQIRTISVQLIVGGSSSGKLQITLSSLQDVIDDNAVKWDDWDAGIITSITSDVTQPVTAIRQVNISGTTQLLMRAQ